MTCPQELDHRGCRLRAALAGVLVRDNAPGAARPSRRRSCRATLAAVSVLTELVDWLIVWVACPCSSSVARRVDVGDALASNVDPLYRPV